MTSLRDTCDRGHRVRLSFARMIIWLVAPVVFLACPNPADTGVSPDATSSDNTTTTDTSGVSAPSFSVTGSGVSRTVTISDTTTGAVIHYTIDESSPTEASPTYTEPILVAGYGVSKTIKAIAVKSATSSDLSSTTVAIGSALSLSAAVTTSAAGFYYPEGVISDGTNLYVADTGNHEIRQVVIATGEVTTLAGSTTHSSTDGIGSEAGFYYPRRVTTDGTNLYVADCYNNKIRKIVIETSQVSTPPGGSAGFNRPVGITTDGTSLYIADAGNNRIQKIVIDTGEVSTVAGSATAGSADGTGSNAQFYTPFGITTDGSNLYVADKANNEIRKIEIATGVVTTIAGSTSPGSADGTGSNAQFNLPEGVTTDGTNLYVADTGNNEIRKVVIATGVVTTIAGSTSPGSADGTGSDARFKYVAGMATDGGNLYVVDSTNHEIRKIE